MTEAFTYASDRINGGMDGTSDLIPEVRGDADPHSAYPGFPVQTVGGFQLAIALEDDTGRVRREMEAIERRDRKIREAGELELHRFFGAAVHMMNSLLKAAETDTKLALQLSPYEELLRASGRYAASMATGFDHVEMLGRVRLEREGKLQELESYSAS